MSFAKVISLISTMTPTGIGFFGYTWEILGNFFVYIFTYVVNAFYGVCKWFLAFVDFLQYFIQKLIGLDYWLSPGGKDLKGATESDLLFSFLYNETVQDVFRALVGLFIVFLIIFTVFAIIRQEWKFVTGTEKDNTKSKILSGSLKAIALVVITPLILVIGIISSNAILASIVKALNIDMSSTFGNTIFSIASVNANKYRIYTDSGERTPVSQQVTFYIDSNEKLVLYGSAASDEYQEVYDDYSTYLEAINNADKYTVNSMLPIVIPSSHSEFYGYCISLNIDGNIEYFMVEVDVDNANSEESKEKISAMYYYLKNVLRANIMSRNNNIGSEAILKALSGDISSAASSTPCLISKFDLDGCKEDAVYEACYNTWDYATIYRTETAFEATTASTVVSTNDFGIYGQYAKIVYNAYDYQKYFDGGQFGVVQLNAEYGVMTDVIDFICETGANLYILDATSSLINWNYEGYQIEGKWVSEFAGSEPTMYSAYGNEYLPFIVDYSETAMDNEEGKTLYFAKANVSNELEGSKFIMCWKVGTDSGIEYIPLLNRETFTDPVTKQTYTFKSTYLSNSYKGLVVAKGNFDQEISSSVNGPDNGDPTYFKVGASLGDGEEAIEYTNEPYYYDIAKSGELVQYVSGLEVSSHSQNQMTLKNINFDNSSFPNYALVFDSIDKSLFRFVDSNTNSEVDITTNMINSLTVRFVDSTNKSDSAIYSGVNDGTNYLFVSSGTGRVLMLSLTDSKTLTVKGIGEDGSISASIVVPSEIQAVSANSFISPIFTYKITLSYDGHSTDTYTLKPLDLQFSETVDGKSLFSSIEKYYIVMNGASTNIKQNMTLCAYFNESSLYNIADGKLEMATFSDSNKYTLQMFRVSLYDFMVGYVDGDVCKYIASNAEGSRVVDTSDSDIVESFDFGIVVDGFEWLEDKTEYSVFNGSSYVAKLLKTKGTTFTIDDVAGSDSKTIGIEVDGNRYYNVKTQNKYNDTGAMEDAYDIINNSMFVGCYRDRATTDFWSCDFHFSLVGNFRFKLKLNLPVIESEQLMNKNYGVFSLTEGIAFDYFFEGNNSLVQFYNAYKVAYWIILIASALIIKTLGTALWGVIKRFYEVTLYYLAMPIAASTMPLDGGKKFGQIQDGLIKNVLGAYGVILGINMFFILLSPVKSLSNIFTQAEMDSSTSYFLRHFPFGAKVLNNYVYILFVLVAFTMIDTLPSVINGLVGGKDVVSEGKTTKENVGKAVKNAGDMISGKSAMDFAGKTVNALSQTPMAAPIKWAAGKVKGGVDNVIGAFNRGASQESDDAAQQGGEKQKSSRADGSDETQTTSQETGEGSEASEANETTEMQNTNSRADGEAVDGEETNAADESQEADVAAEFNKEQADAELGEEGKAEAIKEAAENGKNQEVTNAVASNIVGDKETMTKDNAAEFGLDENAVREIVRQMLGEQGKNMSDEELDKFSVAIDKDLLGNITGATVKSEDGKDVASIDGDSASRAIVANASNEKVKEAYSNLDEKEKDMVDSAVAADATGVSFTEEKHKEATDEQKVEAINDMAKSDENHEVTNAIAGELIDKKMDETAEQNKTEPEVKSINLDEEYATVIGEKLEAGQTISAEEAGLSPDEVQIYKDMVLGEEGEKLSDEEFAKRKLEFSKDENGVVSAKVTAPEEENKAKAAATIDASTILSEEQIRQIIAEILGEKATEEQIAKSKLEFIRDENGNMSASITTLPVPKQHGFELEEEYASKIGIDAKLEAGQTISAEDAGITIEDSQMLKDMALGKEGEKLSDEELAKYKLEFAKDEHGVVSAKVTAPEAEQEIKLTDKQMAVVSGKILENTSGEEIKGAYENLGDDVKAKVDSYASENFAEKEVINVAPENATLANASVNALKVIDKYKDDEDVENAVILKTLESDPDKMKDFLYESGLSDNSSKDEMLEVIAKMKNSQNANAASMALKDINEKGLTDAHASVIAEMMADGKIKTSAWDLASEEEKQEFRQKRKDEKQEFSEDEKKVAAELNMQAVRDYEGEDKAGYDKKIVDAYIASDNIELKSALSTNLILSATGLDNEKSEAYKKAAASLKDAQFEDGSTINLKELGKKGYSPQSVMVAYAKMQQLADKDGKIGEDSVKTDNGKLNADLLMKLLENPDKNTDAALEKLTSGEGEEAAKARAIVSDMLMKGDNGKTPLLTSDEQEAIVAKIAEGNGKGGFLAEKDGDKEFYNKVVAESKKRNQVDDVYKAQGKNIDAEQLNAFGNTQRLQNKVMGAMIETSEGGNNFKNSKEYADLLRAFTGDTKTKHGQDKSDKEMTQSYRIIATKDDNGNYSYSVGKKVNGKVVETKALTEEQVRSLQEKYMQTFKAGTIENSQLKSAFDKLSEAEQGLLAARNGDKGKAMQDLFASSNNDSNYQALLDQINAMRAKTGEAKVSEITNADLQKLINNEDNLGYDPIELENLKKEIIKQKIENSNSQDLSKVVDTSKLSGKDKDNFEYRKSIIEDQVKSEGDNSETLANLFKNSNFVGKDELQKEIMDIVKSLKDKKENKDKSSDELFAMALNERLAVKNESEIQSEIKNYMEAHAGVSKEDAENAVRQKNQQAENTRNLLYSIGASDITKAISEDNLKDKQKEAIKSDIVLSRMLADANIKATDSDYDAKLQAFMASNAAFAGRLNEKMQNMIDPSKQVSAEDKDRFFKSKSQEDLTTKKYGPITEGIKTKNKTRKHLPKESKKYDEWNSLIDKDMEAVKAGKGAYKNLSKEDRKAKLDELKSKKINTEKPEDYYDWDYAKQKEYDDNQNILKNEALNTNISKIKKKDMKAFKPKDKNVILKLADATGDKLSGVPVLRAVTSKFASDDLKAKHNKELLLEEEKIARFNSSAPMRKRSEDFGSNFENFAKSYISKKSIDKIQKDIASKGLTGEAAIKAREEAFAKQLNKNYKVASAKVARDNRVDKNEFLVEKGINAGNVRYKDGTKKYKEVKSRLGIGTARIVKKYEKEYAAGNVSDKTRKKYEKSKLANRSEEAAIKVQNQQKLYDQVVEFNRSYKKGDGDYADLFKKKFGDELYKKYNSAGIRDLEKSPAIVQQRELIKRIENELKKNINRQKYSTYIPAADKAKDRFRADTLTNAKTKAAVEHDRQMMAHFNNAMKQFKAQTAGGKAINPDEFLKSINPAVLGKHLQDFKGVDNEFIKNYLEKGFEKYRKRVVNNSFTPSQLQNLVKLNGTYVDKSKIDRSRISNTVLKSLRASDAEVYKSIVKSVNSARAKADNEAANLDSLKQALKSAQTGVQNNAAKAEAEKIRKAIANSEIKLNNLKGVLGAEEARKKAFEQAIAADRIKKAIRENSKSVPAASSRPHDYNKPDGSPRIIKPGTLDHRQIQKLERNFMANARAELENMAKLIASKESQKLVDEINKTRRDLSYDARENVKQLKALQLKIKKELKNLVAKNDKKTKRYQDELKMQNAKIDSTIKKMSEEFAKMDIII